jgi:nuclear receptor coactivator 2
VFQALEGFIFVVNSQGKVEFVSENITQYLQYTHVSFESFELFALLFNVCITLSDLSITGPTR